MRPFAFVVLAAILMLASRSEAQTAGALYAEGRAALEDKDGPTARRRFTEGLAIAAPGAERFRLLLGLALAYELVDSPSMSLLHYRAFVRSAETHPDGATETWPARRERITEEIERLERRLEGSHAEVAVDSSPSGATLTIDGVTLPEELSTPLTVWLAPGPHRVEAALGARQGDRTLDVATEGRQSVLLQLSEGPEPVVGSTDPLPKAPVVTVAPTEHNQEAVDALPVKAVSRSAPAVTWTGVGVGAAGVAAVVTGVVLFAVAQSDASDLEALQEEEPTVDNQLADLELREDIASNQAASLTLLLTGGLLTAAGVATVVINESHDGDSVALRVGPQGVTLSGCF